MKYIFGVFIVMLSFVSLTARTLLVGNGQSYQSLSEAAADAVPGDTIVFIAGVYAGGEFVSNLQGTTGQPIVIMAQSGEAVTVRGGTNSWQLSDAAHLVIEGFVFENQTGNGFNMDDGGDYSTPSHHIVFRHCTFRNINASGNNDLLKMSGVDDFLISECTFSNGAAGGSGIDMVGCHRGIIQSCSFVNMGSNAIQAKGGSREITIKNNFFQDCGQRSLNLGGSTGLAFFRPADAPFEAAEIKVFSNIFIGSVAPVAFVGCMRSMFVNNTIVRPERWVLRILQETVDESRFESCGDNVFRNNLIFKDDAVVTDCNIGPNTAPETFIMSNNLWYNAAQPGNSTPTGLPVPDHNQVVGMNPLFLDDNFIFSIPLHSPATGAGFAGVGVEVDYYGMMFANPPSIGAIEGNPTMVTSTVRKNNFSAKVFPNPAFDEVKIIWPTSFGGKAALVVVDVRGNIVHSGNITNGHRWSNNLQLYGTYFFVLKLPDGTYITEKVLLH